MTNLLVSAPTGLWATIINAFVDFVFNYAWAIILITIIIKLVLSPLDFMNKKVSRDNAKMQATLGPQMAKLQKQYGHDRNLLNQKTTELYKANGFNLGGSCLVMLVYLVVTMVVFISLFTSLNAMAPYRTEAEYLNYRTAYTTAYNAESGDETAKVEAGRQAVLKAYDERSSSFLWIKNVWVSDTPFGNGVFTFDEYLKIVGNKVKTSADDQNIKINKLDKADKEVFLTEFKADYNETMGVLLEERNGPNGYFIITILAVGTAILSQWLMQRKMVQKTHSSNPADQTTVKTNKFMMVFLPIVMGLITLFYNAVFGLYIIAGQLVTLLTFPIIDKLLDKHYAKKDKERDEKIKMDYSRK
ncbi:MAG: membrane protein insertase YidC [Clostridia bacterium]|nr:membrane protein insertase YidC [Clostridia bacterium]